MENYLQVFDTEADYESSKDDLEFPTVSYVKDIDTIYYMTPPPIHALPIKAVFYDSATDSFVKMYPDEITEVIPTYTPIGVEVIPVEHDVYGTGQAGIMSIAEMNYSSPDVGSSERQYMYWGKLSSNTSLPDLNNVNLVDGTTASNGNLPSDLFTGATSLDGVSKYYNTTNNAPSPYNADGSRNEAYYTTVYSTKNALSDFDGVGNTKVLTELATYQTNWETASSIINSASSSCYPAACCCWRFHTLGTEQGQWYLPAIGEMGYVMTRISAINEAINKVLSIYSSVVAVSVHTSNAYWSSSEDSSMSARILRTIYGEVSHSTTSSGLYVRAFLRL